MAGKIITQKKLADVKQAIKEDEKELATLRQRIRDERKNVDKKPYSHNLISITLRTKMGFILLPPFANAANPFTSSSNVMFDDPSAMERLFGTSASIPRSSPGPRPPAPS